MPPKSTQLQIRLTAEQKEELRARAERAGQDLSSFVIQRVLWPDAAEFEQHIRWLLHAPDSHVPYAEFTDYLRTLPASRGSELAARPPGFDELSPFQQNHVCAAIEQRAALWGVHPPAWLLEVPALDRPHFAGGLMSWRPYLMVVGPVVWRRRGIFTERGIEARLAALTPAATPNEAAELHAAYRVLEPRSARSRVAESSPRYGRGAALTRERIAQLLRLLDAELSERGVVAELLLVGGAVMTLVFQSREQTKDVDAVFEPSAPVRDAVARIAEREDLAPDWLNDAVSGFLSVSGRWDPYYEGPGLRVFVASADYLLAMKILAMRPEDVAHDHDDIRFLCRYLGITTAEQAMDIVERYYPVSRLQPRHRFGLQEMLGTFDR